MRRPSKKELEAFLEFDSRVCRAVRDLRIENFKELWVSEREYRKHIQKRLKEKVIEDENDYIRKIKDCVIYPDEVYFRKYTKEAKKVFDRWDRVYYKKDNMWVSIFNERGKINTAFFIIKDFIKEVLSKGDKRQFDIIVIDTKELLNARD